MANNHNAKYAFYYLLSLAALIFTALSVGMIVFGIIDKSVADALNYNSYSNVDSQLKFAISALFIAAPIYYFLSRLISRGLKQQELDIDSPLRRWLTYFIILVASMIILGVFIGVINNFLSGELTSRFILKALAMLLIAAIVFSFYFYDIKRKVLAGKDRVICIFAWASAALVVAAFVAAWFFVTPPQVARAKRLDQNLSSNIYQLENAVNSYYAQYGSLPDNLEEIKNSDIYFDARAALDPETKEAIVYQREGDDKFSFCATFRLASDENNPDYSYPAGKKGHKAGYDCVNGQLWSKAEAEKNGAQPVLVD
ncbi:MAG: DUF5671 domain-containing protein [Patescibacteria group bacterium]|nr:DUF5671 domain-containing protein [Patescibacteria group bacterium]